MDRAAAVVHEKRLGIVGAAIGAAFDEAERHRHGAGRLRDPADLGRVGGPGQRRDVGFAQVIGQRQFGEDEQVDTAGLRRSDGLDMALRIGRDVARDAFDLRGRDRDLRRHRVFAGLNLMRSSSSAAGVITLAIRIAGAVAASKIGKDRRSCRVVHQT